LLKLLGGNVRSGTLGALSIELLARIGQVGIEPTTSRSSGEVTLPYTTSNSLASRQNLAANDLCRDRLLRRSAPPSPGASCRLVRSSRRPIFSREE